MEELKYLATWVREQHAPEYVLTWLLNQPGIWWSNGEVYQAALQKSGKRLKEYVKSRKQSDLFQGVAEKIVSDESWDQIAISLAKIIAAYQEELVKLHKEMTRKAILISKGDKELLFESNEKSYWEF
ncbi:MAG: hypothetical protein SWJ54_16100, partial [Cyanobacteriota bacterium]|nr:hypothetical protein [Cyanobacteriota bacterium]